MEFAVEIADAASKASGLQVIPWALRGNVEVVHRADNWLEVPWINIR